MNRLLPFLLLVFVLACKSTSEISSSAGKKMSAKQLSKQMLAANYEFDFLQAKARIKFDDGAINQSFTANIRIENNSTIWISLTVRYFMQLLLIQHIYNFHDHLQQS